jgi:hypothetical protein
MVLVLRFLDEAERIRTLPALTAWRIELVFRRAPRGHHQAPLQPGECALADGPMPGSGAEVHLFRVLATSGTPAQPNPPSGLRVLRYTWGQYLEVQGADPTFSVLAGRASVGADGVVFGWGGALPPFAPFRMRVVSCARPCGSAAPAGSFHVEEVLDH